MNTKFAKVAIFSEAQFTKAYFHRTNFAETANFGESQFTEADFYRAKFANEAYFFGAQFTKRADFSEAQFTKANFSEAQFTETVDFFRAEFTERAVFYKTLFVDKANFSEIKSTVKQAHPNLNFHSVQFDIPEHITFLKDNLSKVSFMNTDITRVRFGEDVGWGGKIQNTRRDRNRKSTEN